MVVTNNIFQMRYFLYVVISLMFLSGCGPQTPRNEEKPVVLVSILPQKTFVSKIAGDDFDISILIPHGANPTTYSLLPAQMAEIAKASVWFKMGHVGFELSWGDKILQTNSALKVVDLSTGLDLIAARKDETTGTMTGVDPHIWLSPSLVKKMAASIRDELVALRPDRRESYHLNYQQFMKEIDDADLEIRQLLKGFEGRKFISFHPSLSYFAREYGLEQFSLEQRGKEPTPGHIANLVSMARAENIKVIYIQSDFDRENARMFAGEIDGEAIQVWPLNPEWAENLVSMARLLSDNFK
jgi:zinc transport system substrate-binding protein